MKKFRLLFATLIGAICCMTFAGCDSDFFYDELTGTWECYYSSSQGYDKYDYSRVVTFTRSGEYYEEYEEFVNGYRTDYYTASGYYDSYGSSLEINYYIDGDYDYNEYFVNARYDISGDKMLMRYEDGSEELYNYVY